MKMRTADDRKSTVHGFTYQQPATSASHRFCGALCCRNLTHDDFIVRKLRFSQEDDTAFEASENVFFFFQGNSQ
jgi:hypothetical protein